MFANFTWINADLYRSNDLQISQNLLLAMSEPKTSMAKWNIISLRTMDDSVQNTFTPWYCTYWVARISPEFFPYLSWTQQQRTWWWNAIDRCQNASQTWYKIWNTPTQGALVVYWQWDKFWIYWHVGKIMHYDAKLKKMIVRDMAWVWKFTMSDRREDSDNSNIKCFIYPQNKSSSTEVSTWNLLTWNNLLTSTGTEIIHNSDNAVIPVIIQTGTNFQTWETPEISIQPLIQTQTSTTISNQTQTSKTPQDITLNFDNVSDFAKHFISLRDIKLTLDWGNDLLINQQAKLKISVTDKKTGEKYKWLLPIPFWVITTNNNLLTNYSLINLLDNWEIEVNLLAANQWATSVLINFWENKITKISFEIK
jgi:hypothetical protein